MRSSVLIFWFTDQFKSGAKKERETRSFVVDLKYPVQEQKTPPSTAASSISSTSSTDNTPYMQQVRARELAAAAAEMEAKVLSGNYETVSITSDAVSKCSCNYR